MEETCTMLQLGVLEQIDFFKEAMPNTFALLIFMCQTPMKPISMHYNMSTLLYNCSWISNLPRLKFDQV